MSDLPDYTQLALASADIINQVAVDIASQSVGNLGVNIKAQDLARMAVDIAAQSLGNLGVNIKAQDLAKIAVDIASQTIGNLGVNIKAMDLAKIAVDITTQTLSALKVNITAQDLSELVIQIAAQSIGVYLQPQWAAFTSIDKSFGSYATVNPGGLSLSMSYKVTTGKSLYICDFSFACYGGTRKFLDLPQICYGEIYNGDTDTTIYRQGGNGGGQHTFNTPKVIPSANTVYFRVWNETNHITELIVSAGGYEL